MHKKFCIKVDKSTLREYEDTDTFMPNEEGGVDTITRPCETRADGYDLRTPSK
jgi:hypothetical protein